MAPNAGDSARKGQNMNTGFKHVYGPVPSRRLGRSLGVDALTFKSCSFDCVYCQLGRTTNHTIERKEYIPTADILDEVRRKLENGDKPEYISFAGSGEPTLHSGLGDIIRGIKAMTDVPVVVFTNGSLLWMPEVRADLAAADVMIPSLDGGDAALLDKVNRPAASLDFDRIVEGLIAFRGAFNGQIWLEVMLLGGISDDDASVDAIARLAERIRPDKVQINSVCRPRRKPMPCPFPPPGCWKSESISPGCPARSRSSRNISTTWRIRLSARRSRKRISSRSSNAAPVPPPEPLRA